LVSALLVAAGAMTVCLMPGSANALPSAVNLKTVCQHMSDDRYFVGQSAFSSDQAADCPVMVATLGKAAKVTKSQLKKFESSTSYEDVVKAIDPGKFLSYESLNGTARFEYRGTKDGYVTTFTFTDDELVNTFSEKAF
jgi:hypothetical protein